MKLLIRSCSDANDAVQTFRKHFDQCDAAAVGKQCADHAVPRDEVYFPGIGGNKAQDLPFHIFAAKQISVSVKTADTAAQREIKIVLFSAKQHLARFGAPIRGKLLLPPFLPIPESLQSMPDFRQIGHAPRLSHCLLSVGSQEIKVTLCIETESLHPAADRLQRYKFRSPRLKKSRPVFKLSDAAALYSEFYSDLRVVRRPAKLRDVVVGPLRQRQTPDHISFCAEQQDAIDVSGCDHRSAVVWTEWADCRSDRCPPVFLTRSVICRYQTAIFDKAEQRPACSFDRRHGHSVFRYAESSDFLPCIEFITPKKSAVIHTHQGFPVSADKKLLDVGNFVDPPGFQPMIWRQIRVTCLRESILRFIGDRTVRFFARQSLQCVAQSLQPVLCVILVQ